VVSLAFVTEWRSQGFVRHIFPNSRVRGPIVDSAAAIVDGRTFDFPD
jgi:hypothetical protein